MLGRVQVGTPYLIPKPPSLQTATKRRKCLQRKSVPLVSRQNMWCILEACVYQRLSAGEPAGSMWEKQPWRKDTVVAPKEKRGRSLMPPCPAHPGGEAGRLDKDRERDRDVSAFHSRSQGIPAKPSKEFQNAWGRTHSPNFLANVQLKLFLDSVFAETRKLIGMLFSRHVRWKQELPLLCNKLPFPVRSHTCCRTARSQGSGSKIGILLLIYHSFTKLWTQRYSGRWTTDIRSKLGWFPNQRLPPYWVCMCVCVHVK